MSAPPRHPTVRIVIEATDLIITGHLYSLLNPLPVEPGIDRDEYIGKYAVSKYSCPNNFGPSSLHTV